MLVFLTSPPCSSKPPNDPSSPALPCCLPFIPHFLTLLWDSSPSSHLYCDTGPWFVILAPLAPSQALHTSVWPPHPTPERRLADHHLPSSLHFSPHFFSLVTSLQCRHISSLLRLTPLWSACLCVGPEVRDKVTVLGSLTGKEEASYWVKGRRETPPA